MLHTSITADHALDQSVGDLQRTLALMAAGMDAHFVRAGTTLAGAIETIDRIISAIDGVTGALDESVAGIAVTNLKGVAADLANLPVVQQERDTDMVRVSGAARMLRDHIMEMRQALRVLHIYGLNIKIAASGEPAFVGFVDSMGHRLAAGEEHLEGFLAKLKDLKDSVGAVQQAGRLVTKEARQVVPAVPENLVRHAIALHAHLGTTATMAQQVASIARTVQGRVATMLGALQVGDSTRQRLEHVVSALQMLEVTGPSIDPMVRMEVCAVIHPMLAAQLEASAVDFDRDTRLLVDALRALSPDTTALLGLIDNDAGSNGRPFLAEIDKAVGEVASITAQLQDADRRSTAMLGMIGETVSELTGRLALLQRVQFDVQDIATNTRLLCRRHGDLGKAVSVVAGEVDVHAQSLGKAMGGIRQPLDELAAVNATLVEKRAAADDRDLGSKLSDALAVIREGCQRTEGAVRVGGDDARQIIEMLASVGDEIGAEMALGGKMRDAALVLGVMPAMSDPSEAATAILADVLPRIAALYTMAQEREVHAAYLPAHLAPAPAVAAVAEDDDDDGLF
ncbi:MAG: hypothetical protein NDI74_04150 [Sphingomonas sp.]|uniref:Uncharacterized protein n=1 Tax=Diploscapter pachys TaxID=2018661 RepID=A0A2A2JX60_9BILA|nr:MULTISPECIES: hypothetical protein [Sphingomonas]PAV66305.1 hypothetical protein WR25_15516 [Diploscapter pachys]ATI55469.1 hypothetical protein CP552_07140 [Sphingomonas melonis]MBX8843934.1 hypothetical protein [Sphingomonas melonis]MBX8853556.1 hypothetical protein [Sphingomonas melonis]MBX8898510.1 hypothetical protein [Sphingomonas melonis]